MKLTHTIHILDKVYNVDNEAYQLLNKCIGNLNSDPSLLKENVEELEMYIVSVIDQSITPGEIIDVRLANMIIDSLRSVDKNSLSCKKVLYRDVEHGMICGVFSGLSHYWNANITLLRALAVVVTLALTILFNLGWIVGALYIAFWMIVPPATTATEKLKMNGLPITVQNITQCVFEEAKEKNAKPTQLYMLLGCLFKGLLVLTVMIGILYCGLIILEVLIGFSGVLFASYLEFDKTVLKIFPSWMICLGCVSLIVAIAIPLVKYVFKTSFKSKILRWTLLSAWFVSLALLIFIFFMFVYKFGISFLMYRLL